MPGLDGTGPLGDGQPGRGLGPCNITEDESDEDGIDRPDRPKARRGARRRRRRGQKRDRI